VSTQVCCADCMNRTHGETASEPCSCACHPNKVDDRRPFPTKFALLWTGTALCIGASAWFGSFLYEFFTWRAAVMVLGSLLAFPVALALRQWERLGTRLLVRAAHLKVEQYFVARDARRDRFAEALDQGFEVLRGASR